MKLTVKKLTALLNTSGLFEKELTVDVMKANCEAFGSRVFCFLPCGSIENRAKVEAFLAENGVKVNKKYDPELSLTQIPVSYFKAWHWDE